MARGHSVIERPLMFVQAGARHLVLLPCREEPSGTSSPLEPCFPELFTAVRGAQAGTEAVSAGSASAVVYRPGPERECRKDLGWRWSSVRPSEFDHRRLNWSTAASNS